MSAPQPYSIPLRRELSTEERAILSHILEREAPARVHEIGRLKVVARCGCGACPTVLFGASLESEPHTPRPFVEIATYIGRNKFDVLVAITLIEREGELSELEAWSPEGGDLQAWPPTSTLQPMGQHDA